MHLANAHPCVAQCSVVLRSGDIDETGLDDPVEVGDGVHIAKLVLGPVIDGRSASPRLPAAQSPVPNRGSPTPQVGHPLRPTVLNELNLEPATGDPKHEGDPLASAPLRYDRCRRLSIRSRLNRTCQD